MPPVQSPKCHAATSLAAGKPHCLLCGWNLTAAEEKSRASLKNIPWGMAVIAVFYVVFFVIFGGSHEDTTVFGGFISLVSAYMAYTAFSEWRALKRIKAARQQIQAGHTAALRETARMTWNEAAPRENSYALLMPRPRTVRLSRTGRLDLIIFSLIGTAFLFFFSLALFNAGTNGSDRETLVFALLWILATVIFGLVGVGEFQKQMRGRRLMMEGELTVGKVTRQRLMRGKNRRSEIFYEYPDRTGKIHGGSAIDQTEALFEDMPVQIFYNPEKPSEHTALCESVWEVVPRVELNLS